MTSQVICDGCHQRITKPQQETMLVVAPAGSIDGDEDVEHHFHNWTCIARVSADEMMADQADLIASEGPLEVTEANVLMALNRLDGSALKIAERLAEKGVKGMCQNAVACPLAQYLAQVFHRPARVGAREAMVWKEPLTSGFDFNYSDPPGQRVMVVLPEAHQHFVSKFDQGPQDGPFRNLRCDKPTATDRLKKALGLGDVQLRIAS